MASAFDFPHADTTLPLIFAEVITQLNRLLIAKAFEWDIKRGIGHRFQGECITSLFVGVEDNYRIVSW